MTESESRLPVPYQPPAPLVPYQPPIDLSALTALFDSFRDMMVTIGRALVDAVQPVIMLVDRLVGGLAHYGGPETLLWAELAGWWSHTVFVCPKFECNSRMSYTAEIDELRCVYGHAWNVESISEWLRGR